MENDSPKTPDVDLREEERLNRRQFFNGLGKWSLVVVASITGLRNGLDTDRNEIESRLEAPFSTRNTVRRQTARKKPHQDQPHIDEKHNNIKTPHEDYYRRQIKPGGGTSGGGATSPDGSSRSFE
jgi:hypothetical protein